jgi:hypothetical protein
MPLYGRLTPTPLPLVTHHATQPSSVSAWASSQLRQGVPYMSPSYQPCDWRALPAQLLAVPDPAPRRADLIPPVAVMFFQTRNQRATMTYPNRVRLQIGANQSPKGEGLAKFEKVTVL